MEATELNNLIKEHGFVFIPGAKMRSCPCPKCGKKTLKYADHPHAQGYKNYDVIQCRACNSSFRQKAK